MEGPQTMRHRKKVARMGIAVVAAALVLLAITWSRAAGPEVEVTRVSGKIQVDPAWSGWQQAPARSIALSPQPLALPRPERASVKQVTVRAVYDGESIGFLLVWKDPTPSVQTRETTFPDACSVMVPVQADPGVPFYMGAATKRCVIMHWKAVWADGDLDLVSTLYPNAAIDWYPMGDKGFKTKEGWERAKRYLPGYAAGNPISSPHESGAEELIAEGFGSLTTSQAQNVSAKASWKDGTWTVAIVRPMKGAGQNNPDWGGGKPGQVCFAVWDGANQERGARKAVHLGWLPLLLR